MQIRLTIENRTGQNLEAAGHDGPGGHLQPNSNAPVSWIHPPKTDTPCETA